MSHTATEAPAAYLLGCQFYDRMREILEQIDDDDHNDLAVQLIRYSERIIGNLGAAEAPWAAERRRDHYGFALTAVSGCAAVVDMLRMFKAAERETIHEVKQLLRRLNTLIRPIAEEGREYERSEIEKAIMEDIFGDLDDDDEEIW